MFAAFGIRIIFKQDLGDFSLRQPLLCQTLHEQAVGLAHQALRAVAVNRVVKALLGNDDAGLLVGVLNMTTPRYNETPLNGTPQVEDLSVLQTGESRGHSERPLDLRQTLTALSAASCQNATTICCQHALTETMLVVSLAVVRLECSFHFILCCFIINSFASHSSSTGFGLQI